MCNIVLMIHREGRRLEDYIEELLSRGKVTFSFDQALSALGVSEKALRSAIRRKKANNRLASPSKKFFVVVTPEYRADGCPPADHFIPQLMNFLGEDYYTGLLSASEYYGAAHQRPQIFQVMVKRARRAIRCGRVRVNFYQRKGLSSVKLREFNTPRGYLKVSSPTFTAFDLVIYARQSGGLDNIATVLSELWREIDSNELVAAAKTAGIASSQRLGYLLDFIGANQITDKLAHHVAREAREIVPLWPDYGRSGYERDKRWKIAVNAAVEPEI